jgi:hypothetical protein
MVNLKRSALMPVADTTSTKVSKGVFLVVWLTAFGSVVLGSATGCQSGAKSVKKAESKIRVEAPFEMPDLVVPSFADQDFDIRDYGAVGDGEALNTEAFKKAIAACAEAGGGRVVVPAGRWLTGAIHLKSNVNLHLSEGSEVLFSTDANNYLPVVFVRWAGFECYNYSPLIYARGLRFSNVSIIPYREDSSILLRECEDVIIEKSRGAPDCESFVTLKGSSTERIHLRGNDLSMTKRAVVFGEGVPRDAVTIE